VKNLKDVMPNKVKISAVLELTLNHNRPALAYATPPPKGQEQNSLHFLDTLNNLCLVFHKMQLISQFYFFCSNHTHIFHRRAKFKYRPDQTGANILILNGLPKL
jgi:hypothetical protein